MKDDEYDGDSDALSEALVRLLTREPVGGLVGENWWQAQ